MIHAELTIDYPAVLTGTTLFGSVFNFLSNACIAVLLPRHGPVTVAIAFMDGFDPPAMIKMFDSAPVSASIV